MRRSSSESTILPAVDVTKLEREIRKSRKNRGKVEPKREMGDREEEARGGGDQEAEPLIGRYDAPTLVPSQTGIKAPAEGANQFEIKGIVLNMVLQNRFNGMTHENPIDHLETFERICQTVKTNGANADAYKLTLFPFSLADKASHWEKNIPSATVKTWDDCKKAFLEKFFNRQKTIKFRNDISTFRQGGCEDLFEAWERFKGYTNACPHHGFKKDQLLNTFHQGCRPQWRLAITTASQGSFANLTLSQGEKIIENIAQSEHGFDEPRDEEVDNSELKNLKEEIANMAKKMERALLMGKQVQENKKNVNMVQEDVYQLYAEPQYNFEDMNYVANNGQYNQGYNQGQGYNQNQGGFNKFNQGFNNQGWKRNQGYNNFSNQGSGFQAQASNPNPQEDGTNATLKQLLEGQGKHAIEMSTKMNEIATKVETSLGAMNKRIDGCYADLNGKLEKLSNNLRLLEKRTSDQGTAPNASTSSLPAKPVQNPKDFCGMIDRPEVEFDEKNYDFIRDLLSDSDYDEDNEAFLEFLENCREEDENAEFNELWADDEDFGVFMMDGIIENYMDEKMKNHSQIREFVSTGISTDTLNISTDTQVDSEEAGKNEGVSTLVSTDALPPDLNKKLNSFTLEDKEEGEMNDPSLIGKEPYPEVKYTKAQKKEFKLFKHALEDASIKLPFPVSIKDMPKLRSFVRAMINNVEKVEGVMEAFGMQEVHTPTPKKLKKMSDPGQFTIPCRFGNKVIKGALADTGANINVMTRSFLEKLGVTKVEPHSRQIALADATMRTPNGIVKDLPISVEGWIVPTDFVIVDAVENEPVPLVLGRPFLATVGARLDFESRKVIFTKLKYHSYPLAPSSLEFCGTIYSRRSSVESIGENGVNEPYKDFEIEVGLIHPQELCDAVLTDEGEEQYQEEMVTKYHAFTELFEECLAKNPRHEEKFRILLKALHKVIPKLPIRVQRGKVIPLRIFLSKFFEKLERTENVLNCDVIEDEEKRTRRYLRNCLPHRRMPDEEALDGTSVDSLFSTARGGSEPISIPIERKNHGQTKRQELPAYRIPTLATRATPEEQTLLLKPHAYYDGAVHYRVMNRGTHSPFTHFHATIEKERVDANRRTSLLNNPIKVIMPREDEQDCKVPDLNGFPWESGLQPK